MIWLAILTLLLCTLEGISLLCLFVYVRPAVAVMESLATALVGLSVLAYAWFRRLRKGAAFHHGRLRFRAGWPDLLLVAAAFLLIMPGLGGDLLGVALLLPAVRRRAARGLQRRWPLPEEE
jgi:UPF0716 family protein affecting phage T7 exclusion